MAKRKTEASKRLTPKVCDKCGTDNPVNAKQCRKCKSGRFAPSWVIAKRPINKQVSVEITESNPKYGERRKRITLTKWWPGGSANFNIPNVTQWERIEALIDYDLAPYIGWKKKSEILEKIKEAKTIDKSDYEEIIKDHPDILKKLVGALDPKRIAKQELNTILNTFGEISNALTNANAGFREAFLNIVKHLPKQKQRALEDLELLLQGWSLHTITNVAQQVRARIETIALFEKQIQDPRTFEIQGDNSIHRILERAMWIVDERYWLLHSNQTLRKFIGDNLSAKDKKKYGKKRPDFVCGAIGDKLIILELKRPAYTLTVDDLNQLERYMVLAEEYKKFSSYEAYLVGSKTDDGLRRTLKHRSSNFKILHYADVIDRIKRRYAEFLQTIE